VFSSIDCFYKARYTLTGDKVEFNTVDFIESRQNQPCRFGPVHTGNKVDPIGNQVDRDKLSNSSCCRFVGKTGNKVDRIGDSRLCCRFVAGFGNSRLSTKSTVLNSTLSAVCTGLNWWL